MSFRRGYRHLKWKVLAKLAPLRGGVVLANVQGKKMYLDLSDRVVCESLYTTGMWEKNEAACFKRHIHSGMVVLDIGANVGYYSLLAAGNVGASGKVFAFEPEPSRHRLLEKNIQANGCKQIVSVQMAVSNKTGTARLYLDPGKNPGDHRLYDSNDGRESIVVETVRLDDFFRDNDSPIHFIKMDIQGTEMAALEGMGDIIKRNDDLVILTEFWPEGMRKCGFSPIQFLNTLAGQGFRLHIVADENKALKQREPAQILKMCEAGTYLLCRKTG
jgi:FkbM family methyltransferase